jgi:poly(3-hydroxybutyrate) depolymerase
MPERGPAWPAVPEAEHTLVEICYALRRSRQRLSGGVMNVAARRSIGTGFAIVVFLLGVSLVAGTALGQQGRGRGPYTIDPRAQERTYHFEDAGKDMPYCTYVSSKVDRSRPAPLVIALHGAGTGPGIMCGTAIVDQVEAGAYILAAPMGYNERGGYGAPRCAWRGGNEDEPANISELSEQDVMNVLQMMLEEFNVHRNRIYLMGHSMGGGGTMHLGPKYADTWAAIAPIAGGGGRPNQTELLQRLKGAGVAVIVSHGEADEVVPVQGSRDLAAELKAMGIESEYVEMPGVGHGPIVNLAQERIFQFFAKHSRVPSRGTFQAFR